MKHYWLTLTYLEDEDEDDDKILITQQQHQHMYNMYITININSTTGILTAINVTDIHMIWEQFLSRILKLSTEGLFIIHLGNPLHVFISK